MSSAANCIRRRAGAQQDRVGGGPVETPRRALSAGNKDSTMVTLVQDTPKVRTEPSGRSASAQAIRILLTHVSGDPQEAPRLRAAVALARDLDATLVGVGC